MRHTQHSIYKGIASQLHRVGGVFVLLFLMAGQSGQEVVQASFLLLAAACLVAAECLPAYRSSVALGDKKRAA